jgi:hypothetical protein
LLRHPGRAAIVVAALLVVVNLAMIMVHDSDTSLGGRAPLPEALETISPERGALTSLQDTITVDLRDDLTGVLVVDGFEIPEDQLDRVVGLGIVSFRPKAGKEITKLAAGENSVLVYYWSVTKPRPQHPSVFSWTFRAAA